MTVPHVSRPAAFATRIVVVALALLSVLPVSAAHGAQFFCRMMKQVTSSCCCAPARGEPPPEPRLEHGRCGPELDAPSCCERLRNAVQSAPAAVRDAAHQIPAPSLAAVLSFTDVLGVPAPCSVAQARVRARAPPPSQIPIFLMNCALLT
jgi:hypothetical protein